MKTDIIHNFPSIKTSVSLGSLTHEDRQKIVGAFAWLIQEDKKQNPELYKSKKKSHD